MTKEKEITHFAPEHNHPPPKFVIRNGVSVIEKLERKLILLFNINVDLDSEK